MNRWLLTLAILGSSAAYGFAGQDPSRPPELFSSVPGPDSERCLTAAATGDAWDDYCQGLSPASRRGRCAAQKGADFADRQNWCASEWRQRPPTDMGPWAEAAAVEPQSPRRCDDEGAGECCYSPIVIDVRGNGFDLTDAAHGVVFDIRADGRPLRVAWTQPAPNDTTGRPDDVWLALDRNGNGRIDDGSELFGNFTGQPPSAAPNGFIALAELDKPEAGGNGDSRIDAADSIFARLQLWGDRSRDGISQPAELFTLSALGVAAISVDYEVSRNTDDHGNAFRYRARVFGAPGSRVGAYAYDVFLLAEDPGVPGVAAYCPAPPPPPPPPRCQCIGAVITIHSDHAFCPNLTRTTCHMNFRRGTATAWDDDRLCFDQAESPLEMWRACISHCQYRASHNNCYPLM